MNKKSISFSKFILTGLLLLATLNLSVFSHSLVTKTVSVQSTGTVHYYSPPDQTGLFYGVSSYPRTLSGSYSTAIIDDIIETMDQLGLTIYRMSIYYTVADNTRNAMVQYYLDNCDYQLIVCRHVYDPGGDYSSQDWSNTLTWTLSLLDAFSPYQGRIWVEPVNEAGNSDLASRLQTIVTAVRDAGYANRIIANKWDQSWSSLATVDDPLDAFWVGYHFYFNSWSVSGAQSQMNTALGLGLKIVNTEIGADFNEAGQFDQSEVDEVNSFMSWCADRDIGNTVWMRYGLQNFPTYQTLDLEFPI